MLRSCRITRPFNSSNTSRRSAIRSSSVPRGRKSRSRLWIAAQASGTGVTGISSPMRDMTESHNAWTRARRSALGVDGATVGGALPVHATTANAAATARIVREVREWSCGDMFGASP
jgi:hypothetical protein